MDTLSLPHKTAGARFDDPAAFAAFLTRGPAAVSPYLSRDDRDAWAGASAAATLVRAVSGHAPLTAVCDRLLERMESATDFATARSVTVAAVAGGVPCVPAYLAGNPLSMRRRLRVLDDTAPLAVVVDMGVSASVQHDTIQRRGAAAVALVRLLAAVRPVSLWAVTGQQISRHSDKAANAAFAVRLETAPLDVARAAWLLCAPEAFRRGAFAACQAIGGDATGRDVNWLDNSHTRHHDLMRDCIPALTGHSDFVLVPSLITAGATQFATDATAVAWVQEQLAQHGGAAG